MKMKRKLIAMLMAGVTAVTLTACGGSGETSTEQRMRRAAKIIRLLY